MEQTILLSQALWFWGILFLLGIMPGMGVVNIIYFTATRGLLGGIIASLGTLSADLFYILLATLGSSLTMNFFSEYGEEIRLTGGIILLVFALEKFLCPPRPINPACQNTKHYIKIFIFCLGLSLSNPKIFIFYFAFLPGVFNLNQLGVIDVLYILLIAFTSLGLAFGIVIISSQTLSQYLQSSSILRYFNWIVGGIILFFALSVFFP